MDYRWMVTRLTYADQPTTVFEPVASAVAAHHLITTDLARLTGSEAIDVFTNNPSIAAYYQTLAGEAGPFVGWSGLMAALVDERAIRVRVTTAVFDEATWETQDGPEYRIVITAGPWERGSAIPGLKWSKGASHAASA